MVLTTGWHEISTFSRTVSKPELWLRYLNLETNNKMSNSVKRQFKIHRAGIGVFSTKPLVNEEIGMFQGEHTREEFPFRLPVSSKPHSHLLKMEVSVFRCRILRILHRLQEIMCGIGVCTQDKSALQFVKFCRKNEQNFTTTLKLAFEIILSVWDKKEQVKNQKTTLR